MNILRDAFEAVLSYDEDTTYIDPSSVPSDVKIQDQNSHDYDKEHDEESIPLTPYQKMRLQSQRLEDEELSRQANVYQDPSCKFYF